MSSSSLAPVVLEYEARSLLEGLGGRDAVLSRARLHDALQGRALGAARALLSMPGEAAENVANALWPSSDTSATRDVSLIVEAARASGARSSTASLFSAASSSEARSREDAARMASPVAGRGVAYFRVAYDFTAEAENELSVCAGDVVFAMAASACVGVDWVRVQTTSGAEGFVPAAFLITSESRSIENAAAAAKRASPLAARLNSEDRISRTAVAAFSFNAAGPGEISIRQGALVDVLSAVGLDVPAGWVRVKLQGGAGTDAVGFVPESFLSFSPLSLLAPIYLTSPSPQKALSPAPVFALPLPQKALSPAPVFALPLPQKALSPAPVIAVPPPPYVNVPPPSPPTVLALVSESRGVAAGPSRTCLEFQFASAAAPADVSSFSAGFLAALARVGIEARVALREAETIAAATSASHSASSTQVGAALNMARVAGPAGIAAAASVLRMHAAIVADLETQAAAALERALHGRPLDGEPAHGNAAARSAREATATSAADLAALHARHDYAAHDAAHAEVSRLAMRSAHNEAAHEAATAATARLAAHEAHECAARAAAAAATARAHLRPATLFAAAAPAARASRRAPPPPPSSE